MTTGTGSAGGAGRRRLFVAAILAGSFLLFLVQPMVARMALPRLGGAPAVWNSAMLVYQALLLGGYAYAHWLGRLSARRQALVHLAVLVAAMLWLPLHLSAMQLPADAAPALWVPWLLAASIGPLFFAISAQAPLLQRWFSVSSDGADPYALYAASNFGSFGGLIAYPLLVEPMLAVRWQSWLWTAGYAIVVLLVAACAFRLPRTTAVAAQTEAVSPAPPRSRVALWIALAFVPSGLMLATSTYITTDIVAMPLLWVLPLGLYLLSFTIAFAANRDLADILTRIAPVTILLFGGVMVGGYQEKPYLNAGLALVLLFMASVALHTAMYRLRPAPDRLTGFYLAMSVGGALGGVFAALVAPLVFDWTYEYPLLILAAGALVPQGFLIPQVRRFWQGSAARYRFITLGIAGIMAAVVLAVMIRAAHSGSEAMPAPGFVFLIVVALGLVVVGSRAAFVIVLAGALVAFGGYRSILISMEPDARVRSYFGVYTVTHDATVRQLAHGTTIHGTQLLGSIARERTPTAYYVPQSGVGQAMLALPALYGPNARVGVVGLGAGTLACYARPGQDWRFYEIDPAVVRIAREQFSFLSRCLPGGARIEIGDARLRLQAETPATLDLLALDAFSSDSVPMHLMTREAFAAYGRVLSPRGVLLVHISNRFLDLEPVVSTAAKAGGWSAAALTFSRPADAGVAVTGSAWIALSHDPSVIAALKARDRRWAALTAYPGFTPWTDDYSTILPLVKAFR
ncbi:fused MFS/spermidine synthase [Sphingomonas sp. GB1N7]|uniref:fused MFS/spermidine synthase n=1 Tax=Parasphingomonas caseinilytica TaxID=3096158 RepID=UPI002FC7E2C6